MTKEKLTYLANISYSRSATVQFFPRQSAMFLISKNVIKRNDSFEKLFDCCSRYIHPLSIGSNVLPTCMQCVIVCRCVSSISFNLHCCLKRLISISLQTECEYCSKVSNKCVCKN